MPGVEAAARRSTSSPAATPTSPSAYATQADGHWVLRRPPLGHVLATAHDMGREHTIISALGPTDVPVAAAVGLCTDEAVNGAPFYVMGFVDGLVVRDADGRQR